MLTNEEIDIVVPKVWPQPPQIIPKTSSDVLEAVIGAVFLDSGFNLEAVTHSIDKVLGITVGERPTPSSNDTPMPNKESKQPE